MSRPSAEIPSHVEHEANRIQLLNKLRKLIPDAEKNLETLSELIDALSTQLDAENSINTVAYNLRLSNDQKTEFFADKQPFKSPLTLLEDQDRPQLFAQIGKYLFKDYLFKQGTENAQEAKNLLSGFITVANRNLFVARHRAANDAFMGINETWKETGEVTVPQENLDLILEQTKAFVSEKVPNAPGNYIDQLFTKVFDVLQKGDLSLTGPVLRDTTVADDVYEIIKNVADALLTNNDLIKQKLQVVIDTMKFFQSMGITLDQYLGILGYKSLTEVRRILTDYLEYPDIVNGLTTKLEEVFPDEFAEWQAKKKEQKDPESHGSQEDKKEPDFPLDNRSLLRKIAHLKRSPKTLPEPTELQPWQEVLTTAQTDLKTKLPLLTEETIPITDVIAAAPGATQRTIAPNYWNQERIIQTILVMSSREPLSSMGKTYFHERTHGLHYYLMSKATSEGWYSRSDVNAISSSVVEEFAALCEKIADKPTIDNGPAAQTQTEAPPSQLPWIMYYLGIRYTGQLALTQLAVFEEIEEQLQHDDEPDPVALFNQLVPDVQNFRKIGFPLIAGNTWVPTIDPTRFDEGLMYVNGYWQGERVTIDTENQAHTKTLEKAFVDTFSAEWYKNPEARAVLYYLMAIAPDPKQQGNLSQLISDEDTPALAVQKLAELGITEDQI